MNISLSNIPHGVLRKEDISSEYMSVWLPPLSACNLQSLTPLFFCRFFIFSLDISRYVLGSLNVSSGGIKFEIFHWHFVYLDGLFLLSNLNTWRRAHVTHVNANVNVLRRFR